MHFDFDNAVAAAGLTPSAFNIETESSLLKASQLGFRQTGEQIADVVEHPRISRRIGTRGSADWRLVNVDYLINVFKTQYCIVFPRFLLQPVGNPGSSLVENLVYKAALA